jgi:hypothetical protein
VRGHQSHCNRPGAGILHGDVSNALMWPGVVQGEEELWVGLELEKPVGRCRGDFKGVEYFACDKRHGVFVKPNQVCVCVAAQPVVVHSRLCAVWVWETLVGGAAGWGAGAALLLLACALVANRGG